MRQATVITHVSPAQGLGIYEASIKIITLLLEGISLKFLLALGFHNLLVYDKINMSYLYVLQRLRLLCAGILPHLLMVVKEPDCICSQ